MGVRLPDGKKVERRFPGMSRVSNIVLGRLLVSPTLNRHYCSPLKWESCSKGPHFPLPYAAGATVAQVLVFVDSELAEQWLPAVAGGERQYTLNSSYPRQVGWGPLDRICSQGGSINDELPLFKCKSLICKRGRLALQDLSAEPLRTVKSYRLGRRVMLTVELSRYARVLLFLEESEFQRCKCHAIHR